MLSFLTSFSFRFFLFLKDACKYRLFRVSWSLTNVYTELLLQILVMEDKIVRLISYCKIKYFNISSCDQSFMKLEMVCLFDFKLKPIFT